MDCFELKDDFAVIKLNKENIEEKEKIYNCFIVFEPNNDRTLKGKDKISVEGQECALTLFNKVLNYSLSTNTGWI